MRYLYFNMEHQTLEHSDFVETVEEYGSKRTMSKKII